MGLKEGVTFERRDVRPKNVFEREFHKYCSIYGGMVNAHAHGDRAHTVDPADGFYSSTGKSIRELSRASLPEKQKLTYKLHQSEAFTPESIRKRMTQIIEDSMRFGVRELWTTVDVTYNSEHRSLDIARELKEEYAEKGFNLMIGAYNPSGFKNKEAKEKKDGDTQRRFDIFESAADKADFLMGLAEKDRGVTHIGEREHNFYMLQKAYELGKPVHFHVGQENRPTDKTLELLLDDLAIVQDKVLRVSPDKFPDVVAIHAISTACQSDSYINGISKEMALRKIKLISCPKAAVGMTQDRNLDAPIHNSIAPLWRMAVNGVRIGIGTDNCDDIFMEDGNIDLWEEIPHISSGLRYYGPRILAKVSCGVELDDFDRSALRENLFPGETFK